MNALPMLLLFVVALLAGCQSGVMVELPGPLGQALRAATGVAPAIPGAFADVDEPEEIELGRAVSANLGSRYPLLRDRALTRYVTLVGNVVAAESERPDVRYRFAVLDTAEVNAFAAPGGFIFVTRGALAAMRDEATLAGVLAHEVAHIALRHGIDDVKVAKRKHLAVVGVQQGLAQTRVGAFSSLIAVAADAVADQIVLKGYGRADESAADRAGIGYAGRVGYDPAGLRDFLQTLGQRSAQDASMARFFATHPPTGDRLNEVTPLIQAQAGGVRNPERFAAALRGGG
jgi:predicted Zn-dependent protease